MRANIWRTNLKPHDGLEISDGGDEHVDRVKEGLLEVSLNADRFCSGAVAHRPLNLKLGRESVARPEACAAKGGYKDEQVGQCHVYCCAERASRLDKIVHFIVAATSFW